MGEKIIVDNNKQLPPKKKEVELMASPIAATPVLKGKDLVDLVNDLKKPDKGKEKRRKALEMLRLTMKGK